MLERTLARLAAAGIQVIPAELKAHCILERDGFIALIERRDDRLGNAGAAGLLTEWGLAPLVWREGRAIFVAKGHEQPATEAQVAQLRAFQADLETALLPE
jgi:hypothetical protein